MVACFFLCYQNGDSPPLSKCAKDLLRSLRYSIPTVSLEQAVLSGTCGTDRAFFISRVELTCIEGQTSPHRFSQSLTRLRCLLNDVGKLEQHDHNLLPIVLNSLSVAAAVSLPMLAHPRRNDSTLRFGRSYVNSGFNWLLYENAVYDIATHSDLASFHEKISKVFLFLGVPPSSWDHHGNQMTLICKAALFRTMASLDPSVMQEKLTSGYLGDMLAEAGSFEGQQHFHGDENETCMDARRLSVAQLHAHVSDVLKTQFPGCSIHLYGSCYSGLSHATADVDLSLHIPDLPCHHNLDRQTAEFVLEKVFLQLLDDCGKEITCLEAATKARVPVVKGAFIGADVLLDFDITLNNNLGVANSELLLQYSQVDYRVKWLMKAVKSWAKAQGIASTKDHHLSSYGWVNLVIFYLQVVHFVPNLQCQDLKRLVGIKTLLDCQWDNIDGLDTFFLTWKQASSVWKMPTKLSELSRKELLCGFFMFYTKWYPTALYTVSICHGGFRLKDETVPTRGLFLSIEDPFETFDSARPHDLGRHMDGAGAARIAQSLHAAVSKMRKQGKDEDSSVVQPCS